MNLEVPTLHQNFGLQFSPSYFGFNLISAPIDVIQVTDEVSRIFGTPKNKTTLVKSKSGRVFEIQTHYTLSDNEIITNGLICELLKRYYAIGWHLSISTILHDLEICSLIFEKSHILSTNVMCLRFENFQTISITIPAAIGPSIRMVFANNPIFEITRYDAFFQYYQLQVVIHTNLYKQTEISYSTVALVALLAQLNLHGWIHIAAINNAKFGLNSLYFRYDPNVTRQYGNSFFGMSLQSDNRIHLHNAPAHVITTLSSMLPTLWKKGAKKGDVVQNDFSIELKGSVWDNRGQASVDSKKLMCDIFSLLRQLNWEVYCTCYLDNSKTKKSAYVFRFNPYNNNSAKNTVCISWSKLMNKMKIVNANKTVVDIIYRNVIQPKSSYFICDVYNHNDTWRFKFSVTPFYEDPTYGFYLNIELLKLMMEILKSLKVQSSKFICSVDFGYLYPHNREDAPRVSKAGYLHSWFLATN